MDSDKNESGRKKKVRRGGSRERRRREAMRFRQSEPCRIDVGSLAHPLAAHGFGFESPAKVPMRPALQQTTEHDSEGADATSTVASSTAYSPAVLPSSLSWNSLRNMSIDGPGQESVACPSNTIEVACASMGYADRLRHIGDAWLQQTSAQNTSSSKVNSGTPNPISLSSDSLPSKPCCKSLRSLSADSGKLVYSMHERVMYLSAELEVVLQALDGIASRTEGIASMSKLVANSAYYSVTGNLSKGAIRSDLDAKFERCLSSSQDILRNIKSSAEAFSAKSPKARATMEGSSDVLTLL